MKPLEKSKIPPEKHVKFLYILVTYPANHRKSEKAKCLTFGILTKDGVFHYHEKFFRRCFKEFTVQALRELHEMIFGRYFFSDESCVMYSGNTMPEADIFRQLFRLLGKFSMFEFSPLPERAIYKALNRWRKLYKTTNKKFTQKMRAVIRDKLHDRDLIPWMSNDFRLYISNQGIAKARRLKEESVAVYYLMLREKYRVIPFKRKMEQKALQLQEEGAIDNEAKQPIQGYSQADRRGVDEGFPICEGVGVPLDEQPCA